MAHKKRITYGWFFFYVHLARETRFETQFVLKTFTFYMRLANLAKPTFTVRVRLGGIYRKCEQKESHPRGFHPRFVRFLCTARLSRQNALRVRRPRRFVPPPGETRHSRREADADSPSLRIHPLDTTCKRGLLVYLPWLHQFILAKLFVGFRISTGN